MITRAQRQAIRRLHSRNADGAPDYRSFRRRFASGGGFIGGQWCGMFVGIEPDGYTHT